MKRSRAPSLAPTCVRSVPPPPAFCRRPPTPRSQVAGVNYLVHAHVGGASWTVKVHKPLPHTGKAPEVMEVTAGNHVDG